MDREQLIAQLDQAGTSMMDLIEVMEDTLWNSGFHGEDFDDQVRDAHHIGLIVGSNMGNTSAMADALIKYARTGEF